MTQVTKKHPQSILGFFTSYFTDRFGNGITEYSYEQFLEEVQGYHVIAEREMLEKYTGARQALPCAAIRQRRADGVMQYWPFQRTSKVGEGRLAEKVACFWGGHVDAVDAIFNQKSVLDIGHTLLVGRDREQGEEYSIFHPGGAAGEDWSFKLPLTPANLFIANSTVEVDQHHVAIIFTIDMPPEYRVKVLEEELIGMEPMTAQEALDAHAEGKFELESWALIYFNYVRAQELLDSGAKVALEPMAENVVGQDAKDLANLQTAALDHGIDAVMRHDLGQGSGLSNFLAERVDGVKITGSPISDADKAQGYSWPAKMEISDWDHGHVAAVLEKMKEPIPVTTPVGETVGNFDPLAEEPTKEAVINPQPITPVFPFNHGFQLPDPAIADAYLSGAALTMKLVVDKVWLRLTYGDTTETIVQEVGNVVNARQLYSMDYVVAFDFYKHLGLSKETVTIAGMPSVILAEVLGNVIENVGMSYQIIGKIMRNDKTLVIENEGPNMNGFAYANGRTYVDGDTLAASNSEAAARRLYDLDVSLLGVDIALVPST